MRGLQTPVRAIRRQVFTEVARAFIVQEQS